MSKPSENELIEALADMVLEHCSFDIGKPEDGMDSFGLSANANALRVLAKAGKVEINFEHGRNVSARWVE